MLTLEDLLRFFLLRWKRFGIVGLAGFILGLGFHYLGPKHYTARGTYSLVVSTANGSALDLRGASFLGVRTGASEEVKQIRAYIDSRQILRSLIEREQLLPELYPREYDANAANWRGDPPSIEGGMGRLRDALKSQVDEVLGLVWLEMQRSSADQAQRYLEEYVKEINAAARAYAIAQYEATAAGLEAEMAVSPVADVSASLALARAAMLQKLAFARANPEYLLRPIDPPTTPIAPDGFPLWLKVFGSGAMAVLLYGYCYAVILHFRSRQSAGAELGA